jgi:oligoribonuclease NrnB/cAMP/cGMP phosphodiesterase (DHH superfamily)
MISVLTLTYQRYELLEEAIYSFLNQTELGDSEMVVINDSPLVEYRIDNPKVKIINLNKRFSSVGKKLEWGFTQCKGDVIYRLDDDDLLTPWALELQREYHTAAPNHDIYRCQKHYFFSNNEYQCLKSSVNNGNSYKKNWIIDIQMIDTSIAEDNWLTFLNNGDIYTGNNKKYSMIYRWGMDVYHISTIENISNEFVFKKIDEKNTECGIIYLNPNFKNDYWNQLPK